MTIRPYKPQDAAVLSDIFSRSIRGIAHSYYTKDQIEAWVSLTPTANQLHERCTDGRTMLVAVDTDDCPVAFGDIESDGHIGVLYCTPEAAGQGITSALYNELEKIGTKRGVNRLYVEASEAAKSLFLKKGFTLQARRELSIGDVPLHNYAMEKLLTP